MKSKPQRQTIVVPLLAAMLLSGCAGMRAIWPSSHHHTTPPAMESEMQRPAILIYSKTNGFRHEEAIPAGITALEEIAKANGWSTFATENGAVHNTEQLSSFDAVVWHQVSGDTLDEEQKAAFRSYLKNGGGFVGIHGAGGDFKYAWDWYVETLIGAQFNGHPMGPQFQEATMRIEDRNHPATEHLGETWVRTDEWYSFEASPRGKVNVLATLDETTYSPRMKMGWLVDRDIGMGEDHPVMWYQCIGKGRAFYSALGHQASAYSEPAYRKVLEGAIRWAAGSVEPGCSQASGKANR